MPRVSRMVVTDSGQKAAYHVISRTALDGLPFKKTEKDELVRIIQRFSCVYAVDVLGYAIMSNHFHLLVEVSPGVMVSDESNRGQALYPGRSTALCAIVQRNLSFFNYTEIQSYQPT